MQILLNCLLNFYETLHSCSTQPADVHERIPFLSKIPKFEHHSIASGGYHSVRSLIFVVSVLYRVECVPRNEHNVCMVLVSP